MAYTPGNPNGQATSANSSPVVLASDQSAIPIKGNLGAVSTASWTSGTSVNTALALNISAYNAVSVAMSNTSTMTGGVLSFEVSPNSTTGSDGTWFPVAMARIDSYTTETVYTLNTVANRAWTTSVDAFIYFRVRLSTVIAGTGTASLFIAPQTFAIEPLITVGQATASNLQATIGASLPSGSNTVGMVGLSANLSATSLSNFTNLSLSNTVTAVKASTAHVHEYDFYNPNTSGVWVQLFALAPGSVTLGTTAPSRAIYIPATSGRDWASPYTIAWSGALSIAVTTTSNGNTAPASPIQAYIGYI